MTSSTEVCFYHREVIFVQFVSDTASLKQQDCANNKGSSSGQKT